MTDIAPDLSKPATDLNEVGEWQGTAQLFVNGLDGAEINIGFFQKRTGGALDSEEAKWGSGGMQPEVARGGRASRDNVVLTRPYSRTRDAALYSKLGHLVGRSRARVVDIVLDSNGQNADTNTFTGVLKKVDRGDYDDTSKDQRDFVIEISTDA
jgi:hypothetical protein